MAFPENRYKEDATLWRQAGTDSHGTMTWSGPVVCKVVWADRNQLFVDQSGQQQVTKATVLIDVNVSVGDMLVKQMSTAVKPIAGALPVRGLNQQLKLDGSGYVRRALL